MNRIIKFRAWDIKNKQMREVKCIKFNWDNIPLKINGCIDEECKPENLMQFTGLKDKNGKEIYEGDIVKNKYGYNKKVGKGYITKTKTEIGVFEWDSHWASFKWSKSVVSNMGIFEVIGNIYENKELLTIQEGKK